MLEKAQKEVDENRNLIAGEASKLSKGKNQLEAAQAQLNVSKAPLDDALKQLTSLKEEIAKIESGILQFEGHLYPGQGEGEIPLAQQQEEALVMLETGVNVMLENLIGSSNQEQTEESDSEAVLIPNQRIAALRIKIESINSIVSSSETELAAGLEKIEKAQAEIDANRVKIEDGEKKLKSAKKQLDEAQEEIDDGFKQIEEGIEQWEDGMRQLSEGEAELLEGEAELADAEAELADGWAEYYDGLAEYEDGYQEFLTEIADAEAEIADAEQEIADIERPDSYLLGRETNVGYACMENDSAIVNGIANVFPVFFYAVAALVCITTMNRMIEEQRTQIGVLKALGYSEASIMGKYLFYSGSAAISGSLVGYFFGTWFFPYVIWIAYSSMYDVADILYVFDAGVLVFSLVVSILCSMGVTYISCKNELSEVAAELM